MHKHPPEILVVLLNAMIEGFDVGLVEVAKNFLFELAAALAGDDFDEGDLFTDGLVNDAVKFLVQGAAVVIDVVQVEFEFGHREDYTREGVAEIATIPG
jgi:hypothetical protein